MEFNGGHGEARPPCVRAIVVVTTSRMREVRIRWFHSIRWSVVLQRRDGEGSYLVVAFLVRCGLDSLGSLSAWGHIGRFPQLHESENVG